MEFLKEILGDDLYSQIEAKINEHNGNEANKDNQIKIGNLGKGEYVGKGKYDADIEKLNTLISGKDTDIKGLTKTLEELKKSKGDVDTVQKKLEEAECLLEESKQRESENLKKYALRDALRSEKCLDVDYISFVIESDLREQDKALELDENENIKGWDDIISKVKTSKPTHFETVNNGKVIDVNQLPKQNTQAGVSKEEFDKMGYQSRLKLKQEQPEVYAQMTGKTTE